MLKDIMSRGEGAHSTMDSILASQPAVLGSILSAPEDLLITESYSLGVAEIHGQRLAYRVDSAKRVDQTHLVLVRGKLVLQKRYNAYLVMLVLFQQLLNCP